jgi:hypothetical protein
LVRRQDDQIADRDMTGSREHENYRLCHVLGPDPGCFPDLVVNGCLIDRRPKFRVHDAGCNRPQAYSGANKLASYAFHEGAKRVL